VFSFIVIGAQLVGRVQASPANYHDTRANNYTASGLTNSTPWPRAYDNNLSTKAAFKYSASGYLWLTPYTIPTALSGSLPTIQQVDFKVTYNTTTTVGGNDGFRIVYFVGASAAQVLVGWTGYGSPYTNGSGAAVPFATYTFLNRPEPLDGSWSWSDVQNIKFAVETAKAGSADATADFHLWESWVTITLPDANMKVRPVSVIDHTRTPQASVTIRPDGDGAYTAWTGTWADWDEADPNDGDTSYVYTTLTAQRECSSLANPAGPPTWSIGRVRVNVYAKYSDAAMDEYLILILANSTGPVEQMARMGLGASVTKYTLTTSYAKYTFDWGMNPFMNRPWTWTDINNLQAGVRSEINVSWPSGGQIRVTQLYVEISGPAVEFNVYGGDVIDLWGYTFILYYNTTVLTAPTYCYIPQVPFQTYAPSEINDASGYVSLSYSKPLGAIGESGNLTLVKMVFLVDGLGHTTLTLSGATLTNSKGTVLSVVAYNAYFENVGVVPEFPFGLALELALIVPIIYIWWKRKPRTKTSKQTLSPILRP